MRRIYVPSSNRISRVAIHVDAKLDDSSSESSRKAYQELLDEFESLSNVYFLKRHPVTYRGVSMLLSTLDGIETLLKANSKWHHFINLSGSDYPLLDPRWMDIVLKDCKGGNRTFIRMDNSNVTRKSALYMSNRYFDQLGRRRSGWKVLGRRETIQVSQRWILVHVQSTYLQHQQGQCVGCSLQRGCAILLGLVFVQMDARVLLSHVFFTRAVLSHRVVSIRTN